MAIKIKQNISLKPYNTFGIDANAAYFCHLTHIEDLQTALLSDPWNRLPRLILGDGSNILLTQDYPGLVIHNELMGLTILHENDEHVRIKIAAGENWHRFVRYCVDQNYGGVENLSLIPGTVGAAPMQNIGAYGVEIRSVFDSLEAVELKTGQLTTFYHQDCQFGYRNSIFKNTHKDQYLITSITLTLNKKPTFNTHYGAIQATLKKMHLKPSIQSISNAVIQIRQSKLPDPNQIPNAGSFFKNPIIRKEKYQTLQNHYPDMPHYPVADHQIKIPAAWLIEQCGWKGKKVGRAGVHEHQALVLVNCNHASGADLKKLAAAIQQSVTDQFDIELTPEVNLI